MAKPAETLLAFRKRTLGSIEGWLKRLESRGYNPEDGHFVPDPTPMAPPVGYKKQPSMVEIVREMVRSERLAQEVAARGAETFEESEDFEVGDDPDQLTSGWENDYDPPVAELLKAGKEALSKKASEAAAKAREGGGGGAQPPGGQPKKERSDAPPGDSSPGHGRPLP